MVPYLCHSRSKCLDDTAVVPPGGKQCNPCHPWSKYLGDTSDAESAEERLIQETPQSIPPPLRSRRPLRLNIPQPSSGASRRGLTSPANSGDMSAR